MGPAEIVTRRRKWTPEQKATLLAVVDAAGGRVSVAAKRHGVAESLLYNWRAADKVIAAKRPPEALEFMPIGVFGGTASDASPLATANRELPRSGPSRRDRVGMIEIDLSGGTRISVDAFVNEKALSRVLRVRNHPAETVIETAFSALLPRRWVSDGGSRWGCCDHDEDGFLLGQNVKAGPTGDEPVVAQCWQHKFQRL